MAAKDGKAKSRKTPASTPRKEPKWVPTYLDLISQGKPSNYAALIAGIGEGNARNWFERTKERKARLLRARATRTAKCRSTVIGILQEQAAAGSAWHLARWMAYQDPEGWKRIQRAIADADPDAIRMDVTGDGRPAVTLDQLFKLSQNGGFAHRGDGDDTAED